MVCSREGQGRVVSLVMSKYCTCTLLVLRLHCACMTCVVS